MKKVPFAIALLLMLSFAMCTEFQEVRLPAVRTMSVGNLTQTSCRAGGRITDNGGAEITECGVCWGRDPDPEITGNHLVAELNDNNTQFVCDIMGLTEKTTYYVRAYAINESGMTYGNEVCFTTRAFDYTTLPTVVTHQVEVLGSSLAVCSAEVTDDGGAPIKERGVCWSYHENPTVNNFWVAASVADTGYYVCEMDGLKPGSLYYIRAYATNRVGISYGTQLSFSTPDQDAGADR